LLASVQQLETTSLRAEDMMEAVTRNIEALDVAKRNLTNSITCIKRMQMLGNFRSG
jgi:hypothetical protein